MTHLLATCRMKSTIILLLLSSMLLQSCYSYFHVTEEEQHSLLQDSSSDIEITFKDGSKLKTYAYHYLAVTEPSDVVFGIGEKIDTATGTSSAFRGKLRYTGIDSTYEYEKRGLGGKERVQYYDVWISRSEKVRFRREDCVIVSAREGSGFWVTGYRDSTISAPFIFAPLLPANKIERNSVRIPFEEIALIDVWKVSAVKTTLCAAGIAAFLSVFIATKGFHSLRGQ